MALDYPGSRRPIALVRRSAIGTIAAGAAIWAIPKIASLLGVPLAAVLALLPATIRVALQDPQPQVLAGLAVAAGIALGFTGLVRVLDFHLFPWFDQDAFVLIGPATGLVVWRLPDEGPVRKAWDRLDAWLRGDVHDGRWRLGWVIRGEPKLADKAFRYAFLLGANGVGKSQLIRELARSLSGQAHRVHSASLAHRWRPLERLTGWARRVWPWSPRSDSDPWDAGEIVCTGSWQKKLEVWLPSAPTLLILDSPSRGDAEKVRGVLAGRQAAFWYPVRLVIVDQFVPPGMTVRHVLANPFGELGDDGSGKTVPVVALGDVRWDGSAFRAALSGGLWDFDTPTGKAIVRPIHANKSFWKLDEQDRLCRALDGNPLLLAEAAHWIARPGDHAIPRLLQMDQLSDIEKGLFDDAAGAGLRTLVTHRLLADRVQRLFFSHREYEKSDHREDHAFIAGIVRAAVAGGIPTNRAPGFLGLGTQSEIRAVLPNFDAAGDFIPAPGAWPICEAYVQLAAKELPELGLPGLIVEAYRANPRGALRALSRTGWLAREISQTLGALADRPDDPQFQFDLFEGAVVHALWVSRDAVGEALRRMDSLTDDVLPKAQDRLATIGSSAPGATPDVVVALLLIMRLGLRRFEAAKFAESDFRNFMTLWDRGLRRSKFDLQYVPEPVLSFLKDAFDGLLDKVLTRLLALDDQGLFLRQADEMTRRLKFMTATPLVVDAGRRLEAEIERLDGSPAPEDWMKLRLAYAWLWLARSYCYDLNSDRAKQVDLIAAKVRAIFADGRRSGVTYAAVETVEAAAQGAIVTCGGFVFERRLEVESAATVVDEIVSRFPHNADIQRERAAAWQQVAFGRGQWPECRANVEDAARVVEEIAKPFPEHQGIQQERAEAWRDVAYARSQMPDQRESTEAAASLVNAIAQPFPDDLELQLDRARSWRHVAHARSLLPEQRSRAEAAARAVDAIADPFPDYSEIQQERSTAWRMVAYARSQILHQRINVEAAARTVDAIAKPFPDHPDIQKDRATAWRHLAFARSQSVEQRAAVEEIALLVDAIAKPFLDHPGIQEERVKTWRMLAYARGQMPRRREAVEEAALVVDEIAKPFPENEDIQEERATAWRNVAYARSELSERRPDTEAAARVVDEIAKPFPRNAAIQRELAEAWRMVAFARSNIPEQRANTRAAALVVDAISARFSEKDYPRFQEERAAAWRHVAYAYSRLPDHGAEFTKAAQIVEEIASRYPQNAAIQDQRRQARDLAV